MPKKTLMSLLLISVILLGGCNSPENYNNGSEARTSKADIYYRDVTKQNDTEVYQTKEMNEPEGIISKVENGRVKATTVFLIKFHRACVRLVEK